MRHYGKYLIYSWCFITEPLQEARCILHLNFCVRQGLSIFQSNNVAKWSAISVMRSYHLRRSHDFCQAEALRNDWKAVLGASIAASVSFFDISGQTPSPSSVAGSPQIGGSLAIEDQNWHPLNFGCPVRCGFHPLAINICIFLEK